MWLKTNAFILQLTPNDTLTPLQTAINIQNSVREKGGRCRIRKRANGKFRLTIELPREEKDK